MPGDPSTEARLAKKEGRWQTENVESQSGRNRWRGFPPAQAGCLLWVAGFFCLVY